MRNLAVDVFHKRASARHIRVFFLPCGSSNSKLFVCRAEATFVGSLGVVVAVAAAVAIVVVAAAIWSCVSLGKLKISAV